MDGPGNTIVSELESNIRLFMSKIHIHSLVKDESCDLSRAKKRRREIKLLKQTSKFLILYYLVLIFF